MHLPLRTIAVHALALLIVATCAAACSSAPDGTGEPAAQSTEQALTGRPTCSEGYVAINLGTYDTGPNGQPIPDWECVPLISRYAGPPATGYDTCGSVVKTPASLPSTCIAWGMVIDNQPVFACPAGTVPPASLGLVDPSAGLCFKCDAGASPPVVPVYNPIDASAGGCSDNQQNLGATCEAVLVLSTLSSNCLGSPAAGWEFVVDSLEKAVADESLGGGSGGTCHGGCAIVAQPPVSNTTPP
jgi:hypothetical protein